MSFATIPCYEAELFGARFPSLPEHVLVKVPREQACVLFHDLNRLITLLDDTVGCADIGDAASMDRLSDLVSALEKELNP